VVLVRTSHNYFYGKVVEAELEGEGAEHSDNLANINLRRQLTQLEKEEEELEWELTDYGWKVDRMAHVIYRAEEERVDLLTQLGQVGWEVCSPLPCIIIELSVLHSIPECHPRR